MSTPTDNPAADAVTTPMGSSGVDAGSAARVARAAIRLADGRVFSVERPGRHHDVIRLITESTDIRRVTSEHVQGFELEDGTFVDRFEAARVAEAAGQILDSSDYRPGHSEALFSEDVW